MPRKGRKSQTKLDTAAKLELRRALARSCMGAFVRYTYSGYQMGWVHEVICKELDAFLICCA